MENFTHSSNILHSVFNSSSVGFAIIDEHAVLLSVNNKFGSLLGYSNKELQGQSAVTLFHGTEQDYFANELQRCFKQSANADELQFSVISKTGLLIPVEITLERIAENDQQSYVLITVKQIPPQQKTAAAATLTQLQYQSIIEHSMYAFFLTSPDGAILEANKAATEIFGFSVAELCSMHREAIIDQGEIRFQDRLKERREKGFVSGELTGIRKNGERFPIEFSSYIFINHNGEERTSTSITDITERKKQEQLLLESKDEMTTILNNTEEMFMIIDRDYRIVNFNRSCKERAKNVLGQQLAIGDNLLSLAEPDRHVIVIAIYQRVLAGERIRYKHTVDRGLGAKDYQFNYTPVYNADGVCNRFMITIRDITAEEKILNDIILHTQLLQKAETMAHVGSWELNLITNKLSWSDEVFRIAGYEPGAFELTYENGLSVIHPDDRELAVAELQEAIQQKKDYNAEKRFVRPDGSIRFINSKAKIVTGKDGSAERLTGVFHDVTELHEVERELAINKQKYQSLFEQNPDAVVSFDLTGIFTSVNDTALEVAGRTREQMIGDRFDLYLAEEEADIIRAYFIEVRNGQSKSFHATIKTANAEIKNVSVSLMPIVIHGEITGVYGILKDVTNQTKYENELKFQSYLLNTIQQSVIVTKLDGTIIFWNSFAEKLYGWKKEEVLGRNVIGVTPAEMSVEEGKKIMESLAKGESWSGEFNVKHKDNAAFKAYVHNLPFNDTNGNLDGIIGVSWDITNKVETMEFIQFQADLLDNVEQAVIVKDLQGEIIFCNRFAEKLYGYKKAEMIGTSVSFLSANDRLNHTSAEQVKQLITEGKSWSGEQLVRKKDGHEFPVFSIKSPVYNKQNEVTGIIGVSYDISESKLAEQQKEFERLDKEALINTTSDLIWSVNTNYKLIAANKAFLDLLRNNNELVLKPGDDVLQSDLFPEPFLLFWKENYTRALNGEAFSIELHTPTEAGRSAHWDEINFNPILGNGEVIGVACRGRDITFNKSYQKKLMEINQQLETAQKIAKLGYWELDLQSSALFWSKEVYHIFGIAETEFGANYQSFLDRVHPDDKAAFQQQHDKSLLGHDLLHTEHRIIMPDQSVKYVLEHGALIYNEAGTAIRLEGTVQDITEQKLAEQTLKLNEEQLNLIYNSTAGIIFLLGVESNSKLRFISMNSAGLAAIGLQADDVFDKYVEEVIPEPSLSLVLEKYNEAIVTKQSVTWQETTTYPTGTKVGVVTVTPITDNEGNCIRLVGSVNDITELKKIEQSLAISQQEYKSLFDQNPDAVYSLDMEGNFLSFNQGLENLLECSQEELIQQKTFIPFCDPVDLERVMQHFKKVLQGESLIFTVNAFTKKGNKKFLSISNMPILVDGMITGVYGIAKDITKEKEAELQLKELFTQLEQRAAELEVSNKELEQFAYIASHDLQEPLRMVSSFLQLIQKKYQNTIDAKGQEYIHYAVDGSVRMKRLINDLLDYSRVTTRKQELEKVDMQVVINEILQNLSLQIAEKMATIDVSEMPVLTSADKTQMLQLLQNLLSNALKYSTEAPPVISITAQEGNDEWLFTIKDNGIGFDQQFAERIFVIFQRLHNKAEYSGTGIGLAICKKIIDRHGGSIHAESEPGKGSTFYFTISKHLVAEKSSYSYERS